MRELDDPEMGGQEHDQVLEAVASKESLDQAWVAWWHEVHAQLFPLSPATAAEWQQRIIQLLELRERGYTDEVTRRCAASIEELQRSLPDRVLEQVSAVVAEFGVPVARALVVHLGQHRGARTRQLGDQAAQQRATAGTWRQAVGEVLAPLAASRCEPTTSWSRTLCAGEAEALYREGRARAMDATAAFLSKFSERVLTRLIDMLDQIQGQLAGQVGPGAGRRVAGRRGRRARCVRTPPLEYCLVDPATWPHRYERLLLQTTQREAQPAAGRPRSPAGSSVAEGSRSARMVTTCLVPSAIRLAEPWTGGPVRFEVAFDVDDVVGRARLWLYRPGTAFGDFLDQGLASYVSGLKEWKAGCGSAGAARSVPGRTAARPAELESAGADRSGGLPEGASGLRDGRRHDDHTRGGGAAVDRRPVRAIAEDVLRAQLPANRPLSEFFGDGTTDVEGVLYVTRLAGAVHPATITSLTAPIAEGWGTIRWTGSVAGFWQNRRARILPEFCPVTPAVLDEMIRGWFVGRLTGVLGSPDRAEGFQIGFVEHGVTKRA